MRTEEWGGAGGGVKGGGPGGGWKGADGRELSMDNANWITASVHNPCFFTKISDRKNIGHKAIHLILPLDFAAFGVENN